MASTEDRTPAQSGGRHRQGTSVAKTFARIGMQMPTSQGPARHAAPETA